MKTGLTIDTAGLKASLLQDLESHAKAIAQVGVNHMKWGTKSRKIKDSWVNEVMVDKNGINMKVGNSHVYAWIMNYGSGSLMDTGQRNKDYMSYVSSGWFNKDRLSRNNEVLSRQEEYTMINYKTGSGTVRRQGSRLTGKYGTPLSLENNGRNDGQTDANGEYTAPIRYKPQRPEYFFDDALEVIDKHVETLDEFFDMKFHWFVKGVGGK